MKKILLILTTVLLSNFSNAQLTCATATNITANGTFVCPTITGTYPTGTGLCWTSASSTPNAIWYKFTPATGGNLTLDCTTLNPASSDQRVSIYTATACANFVCIDGNDDVSASDYRVKLSNVALTAGTTYYIVWDDRWLNTGFSFTFNFTPATCFKPTDFTYTVAPTTTSVSLGWTAPAAGTVPTGYDFEYGPQGFTQGTGTTLNPTTNSVALSSLTPSTVYQFYVRSNCGMGDYSVWEGPIGFNTVFEPTAAPYAVGFENTSFGFLGWNALSPGTGNGNPWQLYVGTSGDALVQDGTNAAYAFSSATVTTDAWLFSRGVNLTAGSTLNISYWVANYVATSSTGTSSYELKIGDAQTIAGQTALVATETGISSTTYAQKTYTYTVPTTGAYFLGFHATNPVNTVGSHAFFIDNVTLTETLSSGEFMTDKFSVYPNPVNDVLTIANSSLYEIKSVTITDVNGRTIKNVSLGNVTETQVNVGELTSGVYFLTIDTNNGNIVKKFVKN